MHSGWTSDTKEYQEIGPGSTARPGHETNKVTAICERNVETVWDPQHLAHLQASSACYWDNSLSLSLNLCVSYCRTFATR
jgi:hypothetical protein